MDKIIKNYIPIKKVFQKFPELAENFGWTERTLNKHLTDGLLVGFQAGAIRYIEVGSLTELVKLRNKMIEKQKVKIPFKYGER